MRPSFRPKKRASTSRSRQVFLHRVLQYAKRGVVLFAALNLSLHLGASACPSLRNFA